MFRPHSPKVKLVTSHLMTERTSVLVVASNFPPVHSGGVYRTLRLAKYLPDFGWDLKVLTLSQATFPHGTVVDHDLVAQVPDSTIVYRADAEYPLERLHSLRDFFRRRLREKKVGPASRGKKQPRVRLNKKGYLQILKDRITLPYMTPDKIVGWVKPASKIGMRIAQEQQVSLIYSSGPPFSNHLVGNRIKAKCGLPWVADFRDPWLGNDWRPDRESESWSGRKHRAMESSVFVNADQVIFNTERSRHDAISRFGGQLAQKSVVIANGFDPSDFSNASLISNGCINSSSCDHEAQSRKENQSLKLVHTGSFYGRRNIDSLIRALGELTQCERLDRGDLSIDLIGNVRDHERHLVEDCKVSDMVRLIPPMPHQECLARIRQADALLLVQTEAPLCIPGKLYEYIAVGKPVFTLASAGATADLVTQERLGPCVDPDDLDAVKATVLDLVDQYRDGRLKQPDGHAVERYNGHNQMKEFDSVFRVALLGNPSD